MRVVNTQDGTVLERTFDRSPVRIGRSSLNELQIQVAFVSQYHAVIEFDATRLQVRDLGSTNGTALRASGRVPPNTPIDLTQQNYEFAIVSLWFQLFLVHDVAPAKVDRKREGTILSMDVDELQRMMAAGAPAGQPAGPSGQGRSQPPPRAPQQGPPAPTKEENVALQAMRDLAASFVPQRGQLGNVMDIVAFAQKMQDVLDVFFKCFLPLRDGHKQFQTQMDIKKSRSPHEPMNAALAVETARDPRQLAARVLDWSDTSNEGSRAIESMFAEVAMLNGVMRGVRSLLAKLAPASIEAELNNPRRRSAGGMQIGPFRYKTLWELYAEIYGDFAEDEKQAFMLIFGPEFVHAYSELAGGDAVAEGTTGQGRPMHAFGQNPSRLPPQAFPQPGGQRPSMPAIHPGGVAPPPMVNQPPMVNSPQPGQQGAPPQPQGPWTGGGGPWTGGGGPPRR
jgi:type VI secretion system protein ImpI